MLTTIIITTYNRAETLKTRSLPSTLKQVGSVTSQVIVIDDYSTDNTEQVVKEFQKDFPNLEYHKHEKNKGLAAARNTGVSLAKGEYIIFLDDDDFLIPYVAEIGAVVLNRFPFINVVLGGRLIINPEGGQYQPAPKLTEKSLYTTLDDGFIIRKSIFDEIKYDEELLTNEDADFGIQYMRKFGFKTFLSINNCLLIKYGHEIGSPTSWSSPSERTYFGMEKYLKKNLGLYYEHGDRNETEYILRYVGRLYCQGGKIKKGIPYLWKAIKIRPMFKNISLLLIALGGVRLFRWYWTKHLTKLRTIGL